MQEKDITTEPTKLSVEQNGWSSIFLGRGRQCKNGSWNMMTRGEEYERM